MRKGYQGPLAQSMNGPPPAFFYKPPPDCGLPILHQDADILVMSKPAGLLSVPGKLPAHKDCLETRAREKFPTATVIHRLDRGTSGIFVMALNTSSHRHLGLQFERRQTEKTYIALVGGVPGETSGTINKGLRTDWYNRPKQMIDTYMGREAITKWQVIERHETNARMKLYPRTGRSHQLRVHMQFLGHPILGDTFYAPPQFVEGYPRMMLHAEQLKLTHPATGEAITFVDPCPF